MMRRYLLLATVWSSLITESMASQEQISGSNLTKLVIERLNKEGLSSQPVIKKNRVFSGCINDNVVISKRDKSWKTVKVTCRTNQLWNYTFRTKLAGSTAIVNTDKPHDLLKESIAKKTRAVFVLKNHKKKGDKVEESDLILSQEKKFLSADAFDDLDNILGKHLRRSLRKGTILKANHLSPAWLVYKNQKIMIEHKIGEIYVKVKGLALSNGAKGDRILVKNISSNKTVEGFVNGEKKISIFSKIP